MGTVISEFFNVIGPDITLPTNMIELIPYLLTIFFGVLAVVITFKAFVAIATAIVSAWRKF